MERGGEMVWVRFASVEEKMEVMKRKKKLRDRRERISNNLAERERERMANKKGSRKKE